MVDPIANPTYLNGLGWIVNLTNLYGGDKLAVVIDVRADYIEVNSPERNGDLIIDPKLGKLMPTSLVSGGQPVIAMRNIQEPLTESHVKRLRFLAAIKVKKLPKPGTPIFNLILSGAARKTATQPPFSVTYFCGTTTITSTTSYKLIAIPSAPGNYRLVATVVWTSSTPAGESTATWEYDVAGIGLQEARDKYDGKSFSFEGSSQQAWYQDTVTGIFHNAQFSCDEIPLAGDPQPSTVFEGFKSIDVQVIGSKGMKVRNPAEWDYDTPINEILIPDPTKSDFDGGRLSRTHIGRIKAGVTEDHIPFFDDLPNGIYTFNLEKDTFTNIPHLPKSKLPFKQIVAWPISISSVKYTFTVQGPKPDFNDYTVPDDSEIPAGIPPPSNQTFT